jgi:CRISPR-associated protein Cse2 (CRISPR_cse2)
MTAGAAQPPAESRKARGVVYAIASAMADGHIPAGDRAALRREQLGPAFWRLAVRYLEPARLLGPESAPWRRETERRWAAIVANVAHADHCHVPDRRLGAALSAADVAEARVLRLARAHGERLFPAVRAVSHQLISGGHRADWADFADLILSDGSPWQDDVRRRLCLDYYRAQARPAREPHDEEES